MNDETDWNAVADLAHRDWVDGERQDKIDQLEAEIARLRAELEKSAKAALDAVALACEKEREADSLRNHISRMRKVAWKIRERAASEGTRLQHGGKYVDGLRTAANMIDKSMGADA